MLQGLPKLALHDHGGGHIGGGGDSGRCVEINFISNENEIRAKTQTKTLSLEF